MSPSPLPAASPALLYGSVQFDMPSQITGRTYRVFVFKPDSPAPPTGYPVIVGTDGNMVFPIMATVAATFELTGKPALVVCVGYPTNEPVQLISLRNRDLTPPTPASGLPQRPGQPAPKVEDYGGSEEFYRFLIEELRPAIAAAYDVDAIDQTLYGHSMAGLFTLGVLFNHPKSFRNYVASSPSIFWNKRSVLNDVPLFERRVTGREITPRALITVGALEQAVPKPLPPQLTSAVENKLPKIPPAIRNVIAKIFVKKMMLDWRMVDNARSLAERLRQVKGAPDYSVRFHAFDDEDHLTALPGSIAQALAFALKR